MLSARIDTETAGGIVVEQSFSWTPEILAGAAGGSAFGCFGTVSSIPGSKTQSQL
jgi:hypothetical protein